MTDAPPSHPTSSPSPSTARDWFVRSAEWIVRGALLLGVLRGLRLIAVAGASSFDGLATSLNAAAGAGAETVGCWLGGLVVAAFVRGLGAWAESLGRTERVLVPTSERPLGLDSRPSPAQEDRLAPAGRTSDDDFGPTTGDRVAEVRRLIREGAWDDAREAVEVFRSDRPDDPRGAELSDALEAARRGALERLEAELKAARSVNDPEQAMEIHSRMQVLIDGGARDDLDADLARWFLLIVHRRLRGGRIQAEVVELADRVSGRFGHTKEGASLRAALPTLRRSAGLCPRCGKPFVGNADACPECLRGGQPPSSSVPDEVEDEEIQVERREPDWYSEPSDESAA